MAKTKFDNLIHDVDRRPLSESLPPILRIAQEIGDSELENWVRLELNGYLSGNWVMSNAVEVPEYRTVVGRWKDDIGNVLVLSDRDLAFINEFRLRQPVVELEAFQESKQEMGFRVSDLSESLKENLNVEVSTFWFRSNSVRAVLSAIRTQASDKLMSRRSTLNELEPPETTARADIIQLRPNFNGIGLDLRALWRHFRGRG